MRTTRKLLPVLGLTALGLAPAGHAAAGAALDEQALLQRADFVFQGVVERVEYGFSDAQGGKRPRLPHTFVTYRIEEVLHGQAPGATITLRFIGGRGEQARFLLVSELPLFDVGERDVLFVAGNTQSGCPLVDCADGRMRVIDGRIFNDEGRALEVDAAGRLALGAYYDLPEVMTHQVSQTSIVRRDHFEQGEARQEFVPSAASATLDSGTLRARLRAAARAAALHPALVQNADPAQPFGLDPLVAEPAPAERAGRDRAAPARSAQEQAEREAMTRSDGNPVLDASVK